MELFCKKLPKAELHAHINGSVSEETVRKLVSLKQSKDRLWQPSNQLQLGRHRTLAECFEQFKLLHELCDSDEAAYIVTKDVVAEFATDNVKYVELRTTPRDVPSTRMTKSSYVASVVAAINAAVSSSEDIIVRLLLAVDRRMSPADVDETLKLAESYASQTDSIVVGLDFSGDPAAGDVQTFLPYFRQAKVRGLRLSFHLAETASVLYETQPLLSVEPDRIGHGTFLIPELAGGSELADAIVAAKIPIELCLSSNVQTQTVCDYDNHHFNFWYKKNHPCVLCTDDKGVFATSLSQEYAVAAETFNLTRENLWDLSYDTINYIFADDNVKDQLRAAWNNVKSDCFKS